jgi:hypothetical protein
VTPAALSSSSSHDEKEDTCRFTGSVSRGDCDCGCDSAVVGEESDRRRVLPFAAPSVAGGDAFVVVDNVRCGDFFGPTSSSFCSSRPGKYPAQPTASGSEMAAEMDVRVCLGRAARALAVVVVVKRIVSQRINDDDGPGRCCDAFTRRR